MVRIVFLVACTVAFFLLGGSARAAYVPPPIAGHVTDPGARLTPDEAARLNDKLAAFRACSTHEVAVFLPSSLEGGTVEDVAYTTFNTWHVGKAGADNGVLLVVAMAEHRVRIETGKGVGDRITDVQSARILESEVTPRLKAGQIFAAIDRGTTEIGKLLGTCAIADAPGRSVPVAAAPQPYVYAPPSHQPTMQDAMREMVTVASLVGAVVVIIALIAYGAARDKSVFRAFPFAFVASFPTAMVTASASRLWYLPIVTGYGAFFLVLIPLWIRARRLLRRWPRARSVRGRLLGWVVVG